MAQVIDRTRSVRHGKGKPVCRYEVVIYHTERDWDDETGHVIAKFAYAGDAQLWARALTEPCYRIVVRN